MASPTDPPRPMPVSGKLLSLAAALVRHGLLLATVTARAIQTKSSQQLTLYIDGRLRTFIVTVQEKPEVPHG